jgi:hypothetical protein
MKKRAVAVNGAIRVKGSTDALVDKITRGSSGTDVDVDLVTLSKKGLSNRKEPCKDH